MTESFSSITGKNSSSMTDDAKFYELSKKAAVDAIASYLDTNGLIKTSSTLNAESVSVHVGDVDLTGASASNLTSVANAQGTSATGITQPTGGSGILGWLSGIFNKLSNPLAVTGTFWQTTQPVSGTITEANSTAILTAANKPQYDANGNMYVNAAPLSSITDSVTASAKVAVITSELIRPSNTTAYSTNTVVSNSTTAATVITFSNMAKVANGSGLITKAKLTTNQSANVGTFKLFLYNVSPTMINDAAAFTLLYADRSKRIGSIVFNALSTEGSGSDCASNLLTPGNGNLPLEFSCVNGDVNLYGILETVSGFTPTSGQLLSIELTVEQN